MLVSGARGQDRRLARALRRGGTRAGRRPVEDVAVTAAGPPAATGGLVGMLLRRLALVFVVPGVLMLVPGSAGFDSVLQLLSDQTVSGITDGFDTFVTAMSIAYGLMVSASSCRTRR